MPLEWTHEPCGKPGCSATTDCEGFPNITDRITMARAAYEEYAESDGTSVIDFALDVVLFAQSKHPTDDTFIERVAKHAKREWNNRARRRDG